MMNYGNYRDEYQKPILEHVNANGRINLLEQPPADAQFALFDKVAKKNRAVDYREPLNNGLEENQLSRAYFSAGNIQIIQNGLRAGVYQMSGGKFSIPPQNQDHLILIMRDMYYNHALFSSAPIPDQIADLNRRVLGYLVPFIFNEAVAYYQYIIDQSTIPAPMDPPKQIDRDFKQLVLPSNFL